MTFTEVDKLYKQMLTEKEQKKIRALEKKIIDMESKYNRKIINLQESYMELHSRTSELIFENRKLKGELDG